LASLIHLVRHFVIFFLSKKTVKLSTYKIFCNSEVWLSDFVESDVFNALPNKRCISYKSHFLLSSNMDLIALHVFRFVDYMMNDFVLGWN
jgi:hypothetical protein